MMRRAYWLLPCLLVISCGSGGGGHDATGGAPTTDGGNGGASSTPTTDWLSSTPADGAGNVSRTVWVRLEFSSDVDPNAAAGVVLDCGDSTPEFDVDVFQGTTLVVNPDAPLPPAATCTLKWTGPNGVQQVTFTTAGEGAPAVVPYDRSDDTALAPFPDDFFTEADGTSATGVHVSIPVPNVSASLQGLLGAAIDYANGIDGFSALGPIVVSLPDAIDNTTIPKTYAESLDPFATLGLFDVDESSPRFRKRVAFTTLIRDTADASGAASHELLVFSGEPLRLGGHYAFVVTNRALVSPERPLEASTFFENATAGTDPSTAGQQVGALLDPLFANLALTAPPIRRDDVALALSISVRSGSEFSRDLLSIHDQVAAQSPPSYEVTSITADSDATSDIAAIVEGTWTAPTWSTDGTFLARDAAGLPMMTGTAAVPFIMALPKAALSGPVPLMMYQHGQPGNAQDEVPPTARESIAKLGIALIGFTDVANRDIIPNGDVNSLNTQALTTLLGSHALPDYLSVLTIADQLSFVRMLTSLNTSPLDALPLGAPDGQPDVDAASPLTYLGISQGATHGVGLLPYAPEIHAAALVVGSGRFIAFLEHQAGDLLYQGIAAFYPELTRNQFYAGLAIVQTGYDVQDPINHARFLYKEPHALGTSARASVLLIEGLGDPLNPFYASDAAAAAIGVPHVAPVQADVPFLELVTAPIESNVSADTTGGFFQFVPKDYPGVPATPGCITIDETNGHYCAQSAAEAIAQRATFFQTALTGVPKIEDPL